ncbi:T9SS type A sorting domain-containing protein [bacterium]|nr:T9SS type A sorting domain-containing protein [bacterium]
MFDSTVIVGPDTFKIDVAHPPSPPSGFYAYFPFADTSYPFLSMLMIDGRSAYDDTIIWTIRWHCDYTESVTVEWDSTALPGCGSFEIEIGSPRIVDGDNWIDMSSISRITEIPFWSWVNTRFIKTPGAIEETDKGLKPLVYEISAYPNPFNSAVKISIDCHSRENGNPEIEIFDINGRLVDNIPIARGNSAPANREYIWQPDQSLGSGVYLVRARFDRLTDRGEESVTKRVVYLK